MHAYIHRQLGVNVLINVKQKDWRKLFLLFRYSISLKQHKGVKRMKSISTFPNKVDRGKKLNFEFSIHGMVTIKNSYT